MSVSGTGKELKLIWEVEASRKKDGGSVMVHIAAGGSATSAWFYLTAEEAFALAEGLRIEAEWLEMTR